MENENKTSGVKYDHKEIEQKWQEKWEKDGDFKIDKDDTKNKYYVLDMFPYPSGTGLHMGHTESYTASDVYYRFKKMQGFNVLHPQGFDAFGLPAENFAIKTGIHPAEITEKNINNYIRQMKSLGLAYDFDEKIVTSDPAYYKWTQWIFNKFFENGFVYKKTQKTNWCSSCQTVIANEQVLAGECERCGTVIEQKEIPGWFLKITDFADDLIEGLDRVDWPEHTIKNQRNWIGKSNGAKIKFEIKFDEENKKSKIKNQNDNEKLKIEVFTTRPDTLFGVTYLVLAPENPLIENWKLNIENLDEVEKYIIQTQNKTEMDRLEAKEKTGVKLVGVFAVNPANGEEIPVFIADYVLGGYGTGAIMAVPAHDERDYEFARKYSIDIKPVVIPRSIDDIRAKVVLSDLGEKKLEGAAVSSFTSEENALNILIANIRSGRKVYNSRGGLINSGKFTGMDSEEAKQKITEFVGGEMTTNYRLRDWSISRQRYWGCPIPIIYCGKCLENHKTQAPNSKQNTKHNDQNFQTTVIRGKEYAVILVPEKDLPVKLPTDVDFKPTGESPLKYSKAFNEISCPVCGSTEDVFREYDTMDTFVDSSWYFLRYPDSKNEKEFCSENRKKWLPPDLYIGGAEHTYMHLLFARFFTKAMNRIGLLDFDEPFPRLRHQGMVLDAQGKKMSKSKGNVINPDEMVKRFGADSVRTYMLFAAPLEDEVAWNEDNIVGVYRFLEKVWRITDAELTQNHAEFTQKNHIRKILHKTIKKVGDDVDALRYNTAVSAMMILVNEMAKEEEIELGDYEMFLKLLAPFAPHMTEELWQIVLGNKGSIHKESWPKYDEALMVDDVVKVAVQVNGKVRAEIEVAVDASDEEVKTIAFANEDVKKWVGESEIKKAVYVKGRILSLVV